MSCNGCRVLRKGCSESCVLRPCLQWIDSPDAQGNATVFVAKFFGRSGLMGFISAVPASERTAVFKSLLYEACGRTVNPVYGAVGLLWSANWSFCEAAVAQVLKTGTLRPPSPSSLGAGVKSMATHGGAPYPTSVNTSPKSFPSVPTEASHLSLTSDKPEQLAADEFRKMNTRRVPNGSNQMGSPVQGAEHVDNNNRSPETNGEANWKIGSNVQQWTNPQGNNVPVGIYCKPMFNSPRVNSGRNIAANHQEKQEQEEGRTTDGPLPPVVLAPVARRVKMRTNSPVRPYSIDLSVAASELHGTADNEEEREKLELDLKLSTCSTAPSPSTKQQYSNGSRGIKRVLSPNTSESANSEGSVTSLNSTCVLSLSQGSDTWKVAAPSVSQGSNGWNCSNTTAAGGGAPSINSNSPRKALSLFQSP